MSNARKREMNWSQARDRIDHGDTGDKIAVEDPAAAPLGADAEAAGTATGPEHIARSAAAEHGGPGAQAAAQRRHVRRPQRALVRLALAAVAVACGILAIALALAL